METTTIAALATAPGQGGIAVVRLSGPDAEGLLGQVFVPKGAAAPFESHRMMYGHAVFQGRLIDECLAVLMRAPRSYTREDVAEIHTHGGDEAANGVLDALFALGAVPAQPGEFTRRAFLNGRIDLSRAEAVMALVSASGRRAADAALRQLQGGASAFVKDIRSELVRLLAGVEAVIDYPEEVDEAEAAADIAPKAEALAGRLSAACDERAARLLEEGMEVVLCGKPNVGKSSLLNRMLMDERAIVTEEPGTTRDIVRGSVMMGGLRVHLSDTAGIREGGGQVEKLGIERALNAVQSADLALLVIDSSRLIDDQDRALMRMVQDRQHAVLLNKCDLPRADGLPEGLPVSARTGEGLPAVTDLIVRQAGHPGETALTLARHMRLARLAADYLTAAADAMRDGAPLDLCAIDLTAALNALDEITGERAGEDILDSIFSTFCVGK